MSNFKIYLENVKDNTVQNDNFVNSNFFNYLKIVRFYNEQKLSSEKVVKDNPAKYIENFISYYKNNQPLYIDLIVRTTPEKEKIEFLLKTQKTLTDSRTGNEISYKINNDTFEKVYDNSNNSYKTLSDVNKEMASTGKNVANLNKDFEVANIIFVLDINKLYAYLKEYFFAIHRIHTSFTCEAKKIEIKNSIVELKIDNIKNKSDKIHFDLSLKESL